MGARWKALDAEAKEKYNELAKKAKEDYIAVHGARRSALSSPPAACPLRCSAASLRRLNAGQLSSAGRGRCGGGRQLL